MARTCDMNKMRKRRRRRLTCWSHGRTFVPPLVGRVGPEVFGGGGAKRKAPRESVLDPAQEAIETFKVDEHRDVAVRTPVVQLREPEPYSALANTTDKPSQGQRCSVGAGSLGVLGQRIKIFKSPAVCPPTASAGADARPVRTPARGRGRRLGCSRPDALGVASLLMRKS